jgi:hypothetical protein
MRNKLTLLLTYLFPRIQDAIFVATLLALSVQGPGLLSGDGDLGRHITIGSYILDNWEIPTRDIFSHTMTGEQLVPHEWLAQWTFSVAHRLLGLSGIALMIAILIASTFTLTYQEMQRKDVFRLLALLIAILAAFTSRLHWLARPHIFTFLLTAIWTYQLENEKSKVWIFPLIMLVWANTHGAFIVGFVIWCAHVAGWLWEYLNGRSTKETGVRLAIIGISSFAVTFINPAGWDLWGTSVGYLGNRFLVDQTIEYQSPNFHNWSTWPFLFMLVLGILGTGLGGRLRLHEAILFAGWTVMSLYSGRNIPLFAIIMAPYIGSALQGALKKIPFLQRVEESLSRVEANLKGVFWPFLAILFLTYMFYARPSSTNQFDSNRFPVKAVDWLEVNPQEGNMFNNFIWGGYLLYRMWPEQTVFIDGQTDFYGEALTREYTQVTTLSDGWESVLEKYDVAWVIVQSDKPLVKALQDEKGWNILYQDATATILHEP